MGRISLYISVLMLLCSCVYDYEPKDSTIQGLDDALVVIDGDILAGGITRVKVSFTEPLVSGSIDEIPLGTAVWVESENGVVYAGRQQEDTANSFEVNTENLDLDDRYRLVVSIPGRGEYVSEYGGVMISPPIDEITWSISPDSSYANIEVTTHNAQTEKLYCKWSYSENWESDAVFVPDLEYNPSNNYFINLTPQEINERVYCFSEAISNKVSIASTEKLAENLIFKHNLIQIPNTDTRVKGLYCVNVTQKVLDKNAYQYWEVLKRNMGETGGIFSAQPSELKGNISSTTNPSEVVIGYISVSTTSSMRKFIDWKDVKFFKTDCKYLMVLDNYYYYKQDFRPAFRVEDVGIYWSKTKCLDCRSYSNSTRPDFWPR